MKSILGIIFKDMFEAVFLIYLVSAIIENFFPSIISNIIDLNYIFIAAVFFGIIKTTIGYEESNTIFEKKLSSNEFMYLMEISALTGCIFYFTFKLVLPAVFISVLLFLLSYLMVCKPSLPKSNIFHQN